MTESVDRTERTWAMCCHLAALAGFVVPCLGHVFGPLIVWLLKREQYPLVDDQGKEAINFQLSMTIYLLVAGMLSIALIGIPIFVGLAVFDLIVVIVAGVRADSGQAYRYPLTIRFI